MSEVQVVVCTRFNLPLPAARRKVWGDLPNTNPHEFRRQYRHWELERVDLMRRYCYPSLLAQTHLDFTWLVLCNDATDDDLRTILREFERTSNPRVVIDFSSDKTQQVKMARVMSDRPRLVSARLDSDDAFHKLYLEHVLERADSVDSTCRTIINFAEGCVYDTENNAVYGRHMNSSPFYSLAETVEDDGTFLGVLGCGNHTDAHERFSTIQDETLRGWLLVLHGRNVLNHLKSSDILLSADLSDYGIEDQG